MNKILLLLFISFSINTFSQTKPKPFNEVSLDAFISETQYGSDNQDQMELIWWMPTEYWEVVFSQDATVSDTEKEAIIDMVKDYVIVLVVKGKIGLFGGITYETEESIKKITSVTYKSEELALLDNSALNPDLLNFISMIKPMMKNMLGAMGENLNVLLYKNPNGKNILPLDVYGNEKINFKLGDFEKNVSLPLGSLLEEKICPEDQEKLNGKWSFCPIHGSKLIYKE